MELTQLSLAPTHCAIDKSNNGSLSSESENNSSRKRKLLSDQFLRSGSSESIQSSVDLQLRDRLPLDWEQCLDLESGRMYYLNRKTLRKSWNRPENDHQKLDLELNISSTVSNFSETCSGLSNNNNLLDEHDQSNKQNSSAGSNMVALACLNCHLLVILSKSSPSCPNCKYVHSLPTPQTQPAKAPVAKSLNTLSLLN